MSETTSNNSSKLLILDLDETLIYAADEALERPPDFTTTDYVVYKRPGLDEFLEFCSNHFRVAVWTSAGTSYAEQVVSHIFSISYPLDFVWAYPRCTRRYDGEMMETYYIKNLSKLKRQGYKLEQVLMIDDTPRKLESSYGNLIRIKPWDGNLSDRELAPLQKYLLKLRDVDNVRTIEKRWWRSSF